MTDIVPGVVSQIDGLQWTTERNESVIEERRTARHHLQSALIYIGHELDFEYQCHLTGFTQNLPTAQQQKAAEELQLGTNGKSHQNGIVYLVKRRASQAQQQPSKLVEVLEDSTSTKVTNGTATIVLPEIDTSRAIKPSREDMGSRTYRTARSKNVIVAPSEAQQALR